MFVPSFEAGCPELCLVFKTGGPDSVTDSAVHKLVPQYMNVRNMQVMTEYIGA